MEQIIFLAGYCWVRSEQANVLEISDRVATGIKFALNRADIDMSFPDAVVLFHDAMGTREDGIKPVMLIVFVRMLYVEDTLGDRAE